MEKAAGHWRYKAGTPYYRDEARAFMSDRTDVIVLPSIVTAKQYTDDPNKTATSIADWLGNSCRSPIRFLTMRRCIL